MKHATVNTAKFSLFFLSQLLSAHLELTQQPSGENLQSQNLAFVPIFTAVYLLNILIKRSAGTKWLDKFISERSWCN